MADLDLSILDRVKKRLYGLDTQVIPNFQDSLLFGSTQVIGEKHEAETQLVENQEENAPNTELNTQNGTQLTVLSTQIPETSTQRVIRLPQLALNEEDFATPQTQVTAPPFIPGPEDVPVELTREEKLARLVELKRRERIREEQQLQADISHTTLTDEENDLDDAADTTRDSSVQKNATTKKELEEIDRKLNEEKRNRTIQPIFQKSETNPVKQLLAAFDSDSEGENAPSSEQVLKLSPTTSPIKVGATKGDIELDSDSDFDTTNVLDLIAKPQLPIAKNRKNPIDEYAQRLKKRMLSSPTRSDEGVITLDDSGDETAAEATPSDIPQLTKEQQFVLKQRYSRKKFERIKSNIAYSKFHQPRGREKSLKLFNELRAANVKQLNELKESNPDAELLEEIEKEEEEMGNLLEREMERVRRIRKKEKLQEKAKLRLINGGDNDEDDADYNSNEGNEDVPDSEVDSNSGESEFSDENELDDEETETVSRPKRVVLSDDEEDAPTATNSSFTEPATKRHDDSYMFGGTSDEVEVPDDEMEVRAGGHDDTSASTMDLEVEHRESNQYELFLNLAPRKAQDVSFTESTIDESFHVPELPSFQDITETQETNADNLPTQADAQSYPATQIIPSATLAVSPATQIIPSATHTSKTLTDKTQEDVYSDDEEQDLPAAVNRGRRHISKNVLHSVQEEDEDDEADNEKEQELLKEKLALFEAKIRRKELKARRLRKEMERRGIKNIVEGEAEESEDEWKGIGGAENEESDQANSEDERMIDNDFNIDLNDEEVRKKFMEQYQIKDRKELEKLIDDIKNHKLTKRARANRFDIELSDEEDELLMAYRRQKLQEQKQRLLANLKLMKLALNVKSRAFFESMEEESNIITLDNELGEEDSASESEPKPSENNSQGTDADEVEAAPIKKVIRIHEAFVQRQLSFLSKTDDDDYLEIQRMSNAQHGIASDDDIDDLATLKSRSLSNLYTRNPTPEVVDLDTLSNKRTHDEIQTDNDEDDDDDDDGFSHVFKRPSMVASFRSFQEKQGVQVSTKSFSGVTVNKQYKVASGSKASITYMSKSNKQKGIPSSKYESSKAKEIEESIGRAHRESSSSLYKAGGTFS